MIKRMIFPVFFALFLANLSQAEEFRVTNEFTTNKKNFGVTINPLALVYLGFETRLHYNVIDSLAIVVPGYFQHIFRQEVKIQGEKEKIGVVRWSAGLGVRWQMSGSLQDDGVYLEPSVRFGKTHFGAQSHWATTPSLILGYSWIWENGFNMALGAGAEWEFLHGDLSQATKAFKNIIGMTKFPLTGEFSLGWYF